MKSIKSGLFLLLSVIGLFFIQTTLISELIDSSKTPLLLIKIPTRSRPSLFFKNLDKFYQKLSFEVPYKFLITCDKNDASMNNPAVIKKLESYPNLIFNFADNLSKVEAFNSDVGSGEFDILLAAHDDMEPILVGFDKIIVDEMKEFSNFDGVLNFNDGFVGGQCNTLPVIGREFYKRFGYIYNPEYKALVCNVELTNISKILRKEKVIDQVIIKHNHPAWGAGVKDDLYNKNEQYHNQDIETFLKRRSRFFDLLPEEISKATPKLWSILICTIEGREESFDKLCEKLKNQIDELGLEDQIEILSCKDKKGEHTIGYKRNQLLWSSQGKYTSFIDDDDDVASNYVQLIYEKLQNNPDCVSLSGIITFNGNNPKKFIHSLKYKSIFERDNVYFRPPNHLNPIIRSVAVQFSFPEKNFGEDSEWTMAISDSGLLKKEEFIDTPYYFYLYRF